ncbi:MAG TPA: FAD-dependent oxidoreductase, partial [Thermoanaerobaculia bacterium]|nr:FAD-dependent oxidoreductase [Thermoanaerobaculia bacterium]
MYDVAVLGSGIAGSTLAAILGRQGFRVLLLEKGTHPRFAVGEAMQP